MRRPRTYVYCSRFRHKVSIPISLRRVYDTGGLTLCLSYELYETHRLSESERARARASLPVSSLSTTSPARGEEEEEEAVALETAAERPAAVTAPCSRRRSCEDHARREILTRFRLRAAVMGRARDNGFAGSNGMLLCGR